MHTPTFSPVAPRVGRPRHLFAALLLLLAFSIGTAPKALAGSGFFNSYIIASGSGTPNAGTYFYRAGASFNDPFEGANLGTYDRATGTLGLGGQANTFQNSGDQLYADSVFLFFRVYRQTAANGTVGQGSTFRGVKLNPGAQQGNGDRFYENINGAITLSNQAATTINLVRLASGPGTYVVEAYLVSFGINNGFRYQVYDSNNSANYKATFTVTGAAQGQAASTWLGGENPGCVIDNSTVQNTALLVAPSEWFDPFNWSNGVPTQVTDVEIPNYNTNACVVYPNIRGTAQTGPAYARGLAMRGNDPGDRSILRLVTGELMVYGDVVNPADSYIQRSGTTYTLAGGNQNFDGSQSFFNFVVAGGGRKVLNGSMRVVNNLNFISGVLATGTANPIATNVTLEVSGRITGENENSYLEGILIDTETPILGVNQDFGGIGIDLTFTSGNPGLTRITRTTGISAAGLLASKPGIKRTFGIQPGNASGPGNLLLARMGFRYLDRETQQVRNAQSRTPRNLDETQFTIWISTNGGSGFQNFGRDRIDPSNNRVTQNDINTFATTTLGENASPLPVSLIYFTAGRDGKNGALLNWGTAQELNNAGFDVQVSTDGREFVTLATVLPSSASSNSTRHYSYTDQPAQAGTRYYRLRQFDTDGKFTYTPVRTVSFEGTAFSASASAVYPNPFGEGDRLLLSTRAELAGTATLRVTDALGREVARQTTDVAAGPTTLVLPSLDARPAGLYLVRLTLPGGQPQTFKINKQ